MTVKQLIATFIVFSFCFLPVFSEERNDEGVLSLSQIDALIKDTRYDQALEELNKYISKNPENFDNAQNRVEKIMQARNRYSRLAEELIQLIINEPDNAEKIYKVTSELEHLEKYPSDRQLAFIRETRIAAEFNYFRKEYTRIHEETEELINSGQYVAASRKAREGFELYQERFFDDWNQSEIVDPINAALLKVDEELLRYEDIQKRLTDSVEAFVRAVNEEKQDAVAKTWVTVQNDFDEFSKIRNGIYESGDVFKNTFEYLKTISETELTDASFLPFVTRFTVGQTDNENTGIAGVMNRQWYSSLDRMENAVSQKLENNVTAYSNSLPELIIDSNKSVLNSKVLPVISYYSTLALNVNSLNSKLSPDIHADTTQKYDLVCKYSYDLPLTVEKLFDVRDLIASRFDSVKKISSEIPSSPSETELAGSDFSKNFLTALKNISITQEESDFLNRVPETRFENAVLSFIDSKFVDYSKEIFAEAIRVNESGSSSLCNYFVDAGNGFLEQSRKNYDEAKIQLEGRSDDENVIIAKYPEKSLDASKKLDALIDRQISIIRNDLSVISNLPEPSLGITASNDLYNTIAELTKLKGYSTELASLSRIQIQNAQKALSEAELRYNQAETALLNGDFETARSRLQNSRTKFNESLTFSFSEDIQSNSDERLIALGDRITQRENEIVVADVRRLKTQAKNEYYAGNFEQAENLLTQASARWAVTNVEEDMEISSLRALVTSALSMKTGRIILPSAPLYPEMSQILSVASQYYSDGADLVQGGKREDGVVMLEHSLQKIQEVQLVYPLNQEASLLSLRIQKILNPEDFDQMFTRKVDEARSNYKNKSKQQESYADLVDLYEINPKYPGLKDLIYNVELEIGIRQRPVTNVVSTKASDLTKEARNIFNRANGNEAELRKAIAKLDEAISLNPNATDAINLKDKIQISIGGKASAVLSAEDESRYQVAIQELQKNNIITANAIVEQLLQKESNKNSTKILELRKKIKALL